ncbi:probable E3 ubiquitin-protein ligase HERC6 [Strongylocentrotus purpuratus]|uniref:Uncharacterized protein n=1 Tax=Strongylocentrotus purpuratus TaxID=7668 RepID=A0A7M7NND1_STRPU|nr:probable E3 ubiquitin-protein ligase HERC6 [Strongylocentrotus purpuratus]
MIDVFERESSTDWPPGRYVFDPKVWEPATSLEDYEHFERFEEGTRRDDSLNDCRFVAFQDDGDEDGDFVDCSSSIGDTHSDDDSFLTCDEDDVSISCDAFHDDPGVRCAFIDSQEDMSWNHADSVETSPKPVAQFSHGTSSDEQYSQSTKDKERAPTDMDRTATKLHSQQSGSEIPQSNSWSEERIVTLSSDAATHPTTQVGVSLMNDPAFCAEHLVPIEDGITDLCAALDAISTTKDHDCPARETVEDLSGEAGVGQENNQRPPKTWRRLCAGQENIFIIEQDEPMREDVHISITPGREIDTLSAELLQSLSDVEGDIAEEDALFQYASMVFSSPACLNASFRQTGPNEVNGLNIDLKAARRAFGVISKNDKLLERLSDVISVDLCTSIPQSTPHVEALQFIFILMECPVFSNPHRHWGRRALAAAERLLGFLHTASQAAYNNSKSATPARWWKFEPMSFQRTITAYRMSLTTLFNDGALLEKELDNFRSNLRVLSYLNEINLQQDILSIQTFYIQDLDKVWKHPPPPLQKFSWASYPFLIDLEMKTEMIECHNISKQDDAMEQEISLNPVLELCSNLGMPLYHVYINIDVNRDDIFGRSVRDQLAEMLTFPRSKLQKPFMVNFMDETGIDWGALSMVSGYC